ncbi:MAG TPA: hypothetical protein DCQ64_23875 [Candidatus Rokubacteria bacterium]|nr:hypothetical protein [Candidatus Rokubacteria bacterium]
MTLAAIAPIVESTGEIVESNGDLTMETLTTYVRAKVGSDAAQIERQMILQELTADHPRLAELDAQIKEAAAVVASIEAQAATAFSDDVRRSVAAPISLEAGFLRITWGKAPDRWVQKIKPAEIAKRDPVLAEVLGILCVVGDPPKPRFTLRPEKLTT